MWESIRNGKEQILMSTFIIEGNFIITIGLYLDLFITIYLTHYYYLSYSLLFILLI
jgi:hypothetical protein